MTLIVVLSSCGKISAGKNRSFIGTIQGQTYENKTIKLGFNAPSGWQYYSDEEIGQLNNLDSAADNLNDTLSEATAATIMVAADRTGYSNVNITMTKLSSISALSVESSKDYADYLVDVLPQKLADTGFSVLSIDTFVLSVDGEDFAALEMSVGIDDTTVLYQRQLIKLTDKYIMAATITGDSVESVSTTTDCFYTI